MRGRALQSKSIPEHSRADVQGKSEIASLFVDSSTRNPGVCGYQLLAKHGSRIQMNSAISSASMNWCSYPGTHAATTNRKASVQRCWTVPCQPVRVQRWRRLPIAFPSFFIPLLLSWLRKACMSIDLAVMLTSKTLWAALLVAAPVLLAALLVGLLVSVFQVVTQIQEMSLSFVPKLLSVVAVLVIAGAWMLRQIVSFATWVFNAIPSYL
jgi:flagellar biosynthetic protein FliQ